MSNFFEISKHHTIKQLGIKQIRFMLCKSLNTVAFNNLFKGIELNYLDEFVKLPFSPNIKYDLKFSRNSGRIFINHTISLSYPFANGEILEDIKTIMQRKIIVALYTRNNHIIIIGNKTQVLKLEYVGKIQPYNGESIHSLIIKGDTLILNPIITL